MNYTDLTENEERFLGHGLYTIGQPTARGRAERDRQALEWRIFNARCECVRIRDLILARKDGEEQMLAFYQEIGSERLLSEQFLDALKTFAEGLGIDTEKPDRTGICPECDQKLGDTVGCRLCDDIRKFREKKAKEAK